MTEFANIDRYPFTIGRYRLKMAVDTSSNTRIFPGAIRMGIRQNRRS